MVVEDVRTAFYLSLLSLTAVCPATGQSGYAGSGVCGGCHMRLPPQLLVFCQASKEIITCSNCGRILYYTRDMDLVAAE